MKSIVIKICKSLLAFLGFAVVSCDILEVRDEYGTPTMDYTVMGKVVNDKKEVLPQIKVKGLLPNWDGNRDSTYTAASGEFAITQQRITGFGGKASLIFEDESGVYRTDTIDVTLTQKKKGSGWYNGEFAAEDVEVIMIKK